MFPSAQGQDSSLESQQFHSIHRTIEKVVGVTGPAVATLVPPRRRLAVSHRRLALQLLCESLLLQVSPDHIPNRMRLLQPPTLSCNENSIADKLD
jgi:hypothetical protein